jgi:hypothetical protein
VNLYGYVENAPVNGVDALGLKPGDVYQNPQAAGIAALTEAQAPSISQNIEYAGVIYKINGGYTYTAPFPGTMAGSKPFAIFVGDIDDVVATYHTHGPYTDANGNPTCNSSSDFYNGDQFSPVDLENNNSLQYYNRLNDGSKQIYGFLGTPGAGLLQHTPNGFYGGKISKLVDPNKTGSKK